MVEGAATGGGGAGVAEMGWLAVAGGCASGAVADCGAAEAGCWVAGAGADCCATAAVVTIIVTITTSRARTIHFEVRMTLISKKFSTLAETPRALWPWRPGAFRSASPV